MKAETSARYRGYTERKHGRTFTDAEWDEIIGRFIQRRRAHYAVAKNVERGILIPFTCQFCGRNESEGHHPNYSYPLAVVWLCRSHHRLEHADLKFMDAAERIARNDAMLRLAQRNIGPAAYWAIDEALLGFPRPTEEDDWGNIEDFQDTIVEYDEEEVKRSQATSEDCPPAFTHAMDLPHKANVAAEVTESEAIEQARVCPHCGQAIPNCGGAI